MKKLSEKQQVNNILADMKQALVSSTKTTTTTTITRNNTTRNSSTSTSNSSKSKNKPPGAGGQHIKKVTALFGLAIATLMLCCFVGQTQQQPTATVSTTGLSSSPSTSASGGGGGGSSEGKGIFKRSFAGLGCLGVYDKAKFARLDRVCEECYQLYREPDIHMACRQDCFRNNVFTRCVDALLLSHEQKKFDEMVDELYGK